MKKLLLLSLLIMGCKKQDMTKPELIDAIQSGAKLTKADAGKYVGTWWSEKLTDSLVISVSRIQLDSVKYKSNMPEFNRQLTHHVNYEPKDENLNLKRNGVCYSFRFQH